MRANACASSRPETPSQVSALPSSGQELCPQRCQADTLAGQGQSPRCSRLRSIELSRAGNLAGGPEEEGIHYQLLLQEGNKVNQMAQTARPTGKLSEGALCWQNCRAAGQLASTPVQGSLWGEGVVQSTRPRASSDLTCCARGPVGPAWRGLTRARARGAPPRQTVASSVPERPAQSFVRS